MSVVCVVQARMGSTRLPGKVLMDLGGQPMLAFMLERLASLDGVRLLVATSTGIGDDPIEACARSVGVPVVRGDEADVLGRFRTALDRYPADHVVRLTADCPLIDRNLVEAVVERHLASGADYTSNTLIRTDPDGLDVEAMTARALRIADREATDPTEREHVTPYLYRRPGRFALAAVLGSARLGHLRWTVDTADDLDRVRTMVATGLSSVDRVPLRDGFEPAIPGEVPARFERFDDPADRLVVLRVDGRREGWARLRISDVGVATVESELPADYDTELERFAAETPQIVTLHRVQMQETVRT
ncbi:MAG TPA: glycosyltransferase family protein [Microthrixaceae bacterium]|nr:glycosyltransferase family protein [Microthrixaceae bacterium]